MAVENASGRSVIYNQEPARRHAPVSSTGVLGWIRHNLFRTPFDAVLTVLSGLLIWGVVSSLVSWAVVDANWFAVTRNLSLFMLGSLQADPASVINVQILTLILAASVGISLASWTRLGLRTWVVLALAAAVLFVLPTIIYSATDRASALFSASDTGIVSGSLTETPLDSIAFIAAEGEELILQVAPIDSDSGLSSIAAFGDRATDALYNSARNRIAALAELESIEARLGGTSLTDTERAALESEAEALRTSTEQPVSTAFSLNSGVLSVRIVSGDGETVLVDETLSAGDAPITVTIPATGWYILDKSSDPAESVMLLEAKGIYPHTERTITRGQVDATGAPVLNDAGQQQIVSVDQFLRIVDDLVVERRGPQRDGTDVPRNVVIDNQYRGGRPLDDYLRLHAALFLERANRLLIPLLIAAAVGFWAARAIDRMAPTTPPAQPWSRRLAMWSWFVMPIVIFVLVAPTDLGRWGGLFLTFMLTVVGIVASFPIGVALALGRRADGLPAIKYFCVTFIEVVRGVPLITVLFLASLALPLVNPALATVPQAVRAMVAITLFSAAYLAENVRGGLQSVPPGQVEAAKALGMNPVQITTRITLPQALRAVIPALVGQFISLFKDTSLVAIVGLLDLTKNADNVVAQPEYIGLRQETYIFIAIMYFVFSYVMGYVSRRLERSGSGSARQTKL